jgi:hypothetical protein
MLHSLQSACITWSGTGKVLDAILSKIGPKSYHECARIIIGNAYYIVRTRVVECNNNVRVRTVPESDKLS